MNIRLLIIVTVWWTLMSCSDSEQLHFIEHDPNETGVTFVNQLMESDEYSILQNEYIYNGGGVAVADFNNDGLPDIFFTGNTVSSKLYLNLGGFKFSDITTTAGVSTNRWATGASVADVNADGWMDLYVTCAGSPDPEKRRNYFFINNQDNTFSEKAKEYGIDDPSYSTHSAFFDYDQDGDLDLYLLNHSNKDRNPNVILPQKKDGTGASTDKLFRNDGLRFTDVSTEAGIQIEGYGLGIAVTDVNNDGWPDVYITNDYVYNDILYMNQHNGTFKDELAKYVGHTSLFSMGVDAADVNNDLFTDILAVDMLPPDNFREKLLAGPMGFDRYELLRNLGYVPQVMRNTLQINNSDSTFRELGQFAGIEATDWSWAALLTDLDNDGWKDVFITNGYLKNITDRDFQLFSSSYYAAQISSKNNEAQNLRKLLDTLSGAPLSNALFLNNHDLTFRSASGKTGLERFNVSHGAAYADFDLDGDLDLVVNNQNAAASIIENRGTDNKYFQVKLIGDQKNVSAIGARIIIVTSGGTQMVENYASRGYQSSMSDVIHFGVGEADTVERLKVIWPDGTISNLESLRANQRIVIDKKNTTDERNPQQQDVEKKLFAKQSSKSFGVNFKHISSTYVDYKTEPLIPYQFSKVPPLLAVADVNGDRLDDFYIGGSSRQRGELFIQQQDGTFIGGLLHNTSTLSIETDAVFFDFDGDGDKDLVIASGGNEFYPSSEQYKIKLYTNDAGIFTPDSTALPSIAGSHSVVKVGDFNNDNKPDLFFGGMVEPMKYPLPPDSRILINNGRSFVDATERWAPSLMRHGLVKAAVIVDLDKNGFHDLVLTGEYLPIEVFLNDGQKLTDATSKYGLDRATGWWRSVHVDDVDGDGDLDILAGNFGVNSRMKASPEEPITVVVNDFDQNGSFDAILGRYNAGELYPMASRDMVLEQVPSFKKRFLFHSQFAKATLPSCVGEDVYRQSYKFTAAEMKHTWFRNNGSTFEAISLPPETQVSPITSVVKLPHTSGYLLTGNDWSTDPIQGPHDALEGKILSMFKQSLFVQDRKETGLKLTGHTGRSQWIKVKLKWILMTPVLNDSIAFHCLSGN